MKRYIFAGVLLVTVIAAIAGFRAWQEQQRQTAVRAEIRKILAKDGGYMESILGAEKNESSLNYKEFFDLCDKAIEGKRALTIELRGVALGLDPALVDKARKYIDVGNEVIRAKHIFYQKQLELNSADSNGIKEIRAMHIPNVIDRVEAIQRYSGLVTKVSTTVEQADKAAADFAMLYRKYAGLEIAMLQEWSEQDIQLQRTAEQYQALNMKNVKTSQEVAGLIRADLNSASATLTQAVAVTPSNLPSGTVPPAPRLTASMALDGKRLFESRAVCFACHGPLGRGDGVHAAKLNPRPTDLTDSSKLRFKADEERFLVIKYGIPKTGMVSVVKEARLFDDDVWNLVAYLKVLAGR